MTAIKTILLTAAAALALSACDNGPSAVAQKQAAGTQMADTAGDAGGASASGRDDDAPRVDHRNDPATLVDGKPMWSSSRRYSAEENARRAFARNGEAFGADTLEAFVKQAHAFVENPPKGAQTLERRNGDLLIYDPKANIFAVRSKDGAPRTMFRPDEGRAYWDEQLARESRRAQSGGRARSRDDDA